MVISIREDVGQKMYLKFTNRQPYVAKTLPKLISVFLFCSLISFKFLNNTTESGLL